jgi:hypothetical protein
MTDYQKQADNFCKKHGISFKAVYYKHNVYFPEDKKERDIRKITLRRNRKSYTFTFGQSLQDSDHGNTPPSKYDVLACITNRDPGSFEDFCSDFGYDTDSRKAERTYKAVCKEYKAVDRLFGDIIEELQEIN